MPRKDREFSLLRKLSLKLKLNNWTDKLKASSVFQLSRLPGDTPSTLQASPSGEIEVRAQVEQGYRDKLLEQTTCVRDKHIKDPNPHGRARHVASEAIKLAIRALRESSDAFPPLKSLLGGLVVLIDNYDKWEANKENLERLVARISRLAKASSQSKLQAPGSEEGKLQEELERNFLQISLELENLKKGGRLSKYVTANNESGDLLRIMEDINMAIIDYQLALQRSLINTADMMILKELPRAKEADYQSREPNAGCFPGTRLDVLNKLDSWENNQDPGTPRVYWLNGHAGSGKSTIAHTFCQRLYASGQLGASFFCSRDYLERSDIRIIFPTLAFQLACHYPNFCAHLVDTLKKRPDLGSKSLMTQLDELLVKPLRASGVATTLSIDALDEIKDYEPVSTILSLLARVIDKMPKVKFFVTGRPEASIRAGFRVSTLQPHTQIIVLHEIEESSVDRDICLYLNTTLSSLMTTRSNPNISRGWPPQEQLKILVAKSSKYFIFAATCVKLISSPPPSDPFEVLDTLTESSSTHLEGQSRIDHLYTRILTDIFSRSSIKIQAELRIILATIILSYDPLSIYSLSNILNIPLVATRLGGLHSLLLVPSCAFGCIRIHHRSFSDYLTSHQRCSNNPFYIEPTIYHAEIAIMCLEYMKIHLCKNVCSLPRYAMNLVMPLDRRRERIGRTLEYACRFWAQHVCEAAVRGEHMERLLPVLHEFLQHRQILWLEILSLLDDSHRSIASLRKLGMWVLSVIPKVLSNASILTLKIQIQIDGDKMKTVNSSLQWIEDGLLLVLRFIDCIQQSAWHLYHTALLLAPRSSLLRIAHAHDLMSDGTLLHGSEQWDTRRARAVRINAPSSAKLKSSQDGHLLAVNVWGAVEVFDTSTGQSVLTLTIAEGNAEVCFVENDTRILVGQGMSTQLWDIHTGRLIQNFDIGKPPWRVVAVDMSPDKRFIASGDDDVKVWEISSGALVYGVTIGAPITFISFSSSSNSLFICSEDAIQHNELLDNGCVTTKYRNLHKHKFKNYIISNDRSTLAAWVSDPADTEEILLKVETHVNVYDTRTGQVIWQLQADVQLHVVSVLDQKHTISIFSQSLLQIFDYTSCVESRFEHNLPSFHLDSVVMISNQPHVAYHHTDNSGLFIHHLENFQPNPRTKLPIDFLLTEDGTTKITWHKTLQRICVHSVDHDNLILESPQLWAVTDIQTASLTPSRKFLVTVCESGYSKKVYLWDLCRAALAWQTEIHKATSFQVITDNTFLFTDNVPHNTRHIPSPLIFQDLETSPYESSQRPDGNTRWSQVSFQKVQNLSQTTGFELRSTTVEVSDLLKQHFYHLLHISPSHPFPLYKVKPVIDDQGWVTDNKQEKILWVPYDSRPRRRIGWAQNGMFITGGTSGVTTTVDFSHSHDVDLYNPSLPWVKYLDEIGNYIKHLEGKDTQSAHSTETP